MKETLQALWASLLRVATTLASGFSWLTARAIGHWEWQPPYWLIWFGQHLLRGWRYLVADAKRVAIVLLVLFSAIGGWVWYRSRPVPHYVAFTISAPGLTDYGD